MRSKTGTTGETDRTESERCGSEQPADVKKRLKWVRPRPDTSYVKELERLVNITGGLIRREVKAMEKTIRQVEGLRDA